MSKLRLTLACGAYEIMRALADGRVQPDGIDLQVLNDDRTRILKPNRRDECDMAEFNLVGYLMDRESNDDIVALPIYPHRRFRHGFIFCDPRREIERPSDLIGHKIGILGERPAAAIWIRGLLAEHYGLPYENVEWIDALGLLGAVLPSLAELGGRNPSVAVEQLLLDGQISAIIAPSFPGSFLRGDERIRRLFVDFKAEEIRYFQMTGIFPIMHTVVVRRSIVDEHPWVASAMAKAFEESKRLAYETIRNPRVLPLAFFESAWEEQRSLLGPDPWRYGLSESNRRNLETIVRYSYEQGLISRMPSLEEAFVVLEDSSFYGTPGF